MRQKKQRPGILYRNKMGGESFMSPLEYPLEWYVSHCPFCGKPVRGEEWLKGSHLCKGLKEAMKIISDKGD